MRIFKYVLPQALIPGHVQIPMPKAATLLSCANQSGSLVVWAAVDDLAVLVARKFFVPFTGDEMPRDFDGGFLGTAQIGRIVFHVFDEGEQP